MTEPGPETRTFTASDGYPLHVACWLPPSSPRGQVVVLHGVQSHGGWYHRLGRTLAEAGFVTSFPDRRGSGADPRERGHAPGAPADPRPGRMATRLAQGAAGAPAFARWDQLGGKLAVIVAARNPELVDSLALICPGLHPRVGVSRKEALADCLGVPHESPQAVHHTLIRPRTFHRQCGRPGVYRRRSAWASPGYGRPLGGQLRHRSPGREGPLQDSPAGAFDAGGSRPDRR